MALRSASEWMATVWMPISLQRAVHAEGDLPAVRYEDLVEHRGRYSMMTRGSPNSTGCWFSIRICVTLPARGAVTGLNVFIGFDQHQRLAGVDGVADLHEFRRAFFGLQVDRADHRRLHSARMIAQRRLGGRGGCCGSAGCCAAAGRSGA